MRIFKISIIGNSVALRCRPRLETSKNYGQYLEEMLNDKYPKQLTYVENKAFSRATVVDVNSILKQQIANKLSNIYIVNLGVCDASTREIAYWYANILNQNRESIIKFILKNIHHYIIKKNNSLFVGLRGKKTWISKKKFKALYSNIFYEIKRNNNPKFIIISINLPNERVEKILPGSLQKCIEYNEILKKIADEENAIFISCDDLKSEIHYPDGSHYSDAGHRVIARRIFNLINVTEHK